MKKLNWIHVLLCVFIGRIILMSASYPDAICLVALIAYKFSDKYFKAKNVEDTVMQEIKEAKEEMKKARESVDAVKIATGFGMKRG